MNETNISNFRRWARAAGALMLKRWYLAAMLLSVLLFGWNELQNYFDRRAVESQNQKIEKFDAEKKASQEQTDKLLDLFQQQHTQTVSILDAIKSVNGTVNLLVENDRRQDEQVKNLRDEYQNARQPNQTNQTKSNQQIVNLRRVRANRPLRQREDDILAIDRDLYPNAGR